MISRTACKQKAILVKTPRSPDDSAPSRADDATVRSVRRAIAILRAFGPGDASLPLGEIARRTALDKATALRLLRTLIGEGLVVQDSRTRDYALGLGVFSLATGPTPADTLRHAALPLLAAAAEATGTTAYLMVPEGTDALCIAAVTSERAAVPLVTVGERVNLHAGAAARVLMAFLPLDARMAALAGPLPPLSPATPTDPFQLSAQLDTIRQRGWELGIDEVDPGIVSLAVPVRAPSGAVTAALGLAGPQPEMLEGEAPRHLLRAQSTARELERRLAARGGA